MQRMAGVVPVDRTRRRLFVCLFGCSESSRGAAVLHWYGKKGGREKVDGCIVFYSMGKGVPCVRFGHRVTSLKIECQPRKKCHNIPRVCSPGDCFLLHLPSTSLPLALCFREHERRARDGRTSAFILIETVYILDGGKGIASGCGYKYPRTAPERR